MNLNYNVTAMIANNALQNTDTKLSESIQRLSSGLKIANAKDNPSGLAMSRRMNSQIESLGVAGDSTNDGISIVQTADGTLAEIQEMLQRMNELAVKASNGTMTSSDRSIVQEEVAQLKAEITRASQTTQFNGQNLLDGTFDLRGYATVNGVTSNNVKVSTYSDQMETGKFEIQNLTASYDKNTNRLSGVSGSVTVNQVITDAAGNVTRRDMEMNNLTYDGDIIKISNDEGMSLSLKIDENISGDLIELDLTGQGAMTMQVGANEKQTIDIRIPSMSLSNIGIFNVDVSTEQGAKEAIDQVKNGIAYVSAARSSIGAQQNRLEHTDASINVTTENMTAAYSRIMDVDMAEEMAEYSTQQVLSQAGISMMAQANQRPSEILQLLQ